MSGHGSRRRLLDMGTSKDAASMGRPVKTRPFIADVHLMTIQVAQAYGGQLPQTPPALLPLGVFRRAGWADRLIVVSNCLWAAALAWRIGAVARARRLTK